MNNNMIPTTREAYCTKCQQVTKQLDNTAYFLCCTCGTRNNLMNITGNAYPLDDWKGKYPLNKKENNNMTEQEFKTAVAQILKDNTHFVQGGYVAFGALDKIWELHKNQLPSIKVTEFKPNIEVPDLVDIEQAEQANALPDKEIYTLGSPDNETELEADKIYKAYCKLRGIDLHLLDASVFYLGFKAGKKLRQL